MRANEVLCVPMCTCQESSDACCTTQLMGSMKAWHTMSLLYSAWIDLSACAVAFSTSPSSTQAALFSGLSSWLENSSMMSERLSFP